MDTKDETIDVNCKKITKDGLVCDINKKNLTKMIGLGMDPDHTHFNVKDELSDSPKSNDCGCSTNSTDSSNPSAEPKSQSETDQKSEGD